MQSVYRYIDKKSYLDWGKTSDWLVDGPRKRRSSNKFEPYAPATSPSPAAACETTTRTDEEEDVNASSEGERAIQLI